MNPDLEPGAPLDLTVVRRRVSDPRAMAGAAGYALTLQVMHPTVAGGVRTSSTYAADPWARAFRTVDYVFLLCYGAPARRRRLVHDLRAAHRHIPGGLDPEAFAWVHATIGDAIVRAHNAMGTRFDDHERERFWQEWLGLGDLLGVRDLPRSWAAFRAYRQAMVDDVLEDNDVVQDVLRNARHAVGSPPVRWLPRPVFNLVSPSVGRLARFVGIGMLPDDLKQRIHVRWTPRDQALYRAYCQGSRLAPVPRRIGPLVLWLRQREPGPFEPVLVRG